VLQAFDTELDTLGVTSVVVRRAQAVEVTSKTTAIDVRAIHILQDESQWDWRGIRDYVHDQICQIHGDFPPLEAKKEYGLFTAYLNRWPNEGFPAITGPQIARYAFEVEAGWWYGAPIGYSRFMKSSDGYFAVPIATKLQIAAPFISAL
jgi:hypothetical protein